MEIMALLQQHCLPCGAGNPKGATGGPDDSTSLYDKFANFASKFSCISSYLGTLKLRELFMFLLFRNEPSTESKFIHDAIGEENCAFQVNQQWLHWWHPVRLHRAHSAPSSPAYAARCHQ